VEVKIGVQYGPRELSLESSMTPAEVEAAVAEAVAAGGRLTLMDDRGRRVMIPVEKLAYVEIAEASPRPVGFSAG
jgi:Protein of unknown function (DUF3107)